MLSFQSLTRMVAQLFGSVVLCLLNPHHYSLDCDTPLPRGWLCIRFLRIT